jgi:signal transduction histidine kinase
VLRSVVERFGAHSSSLQVLYAGGSRILFLQNWEGGRLHSAEEYADSPLVKAYEQSVNVAGVRDTYERPEAGVFTIRESGPPWTPELRKALLDMGVRTIANLPLMIGSRVIGRLVIRFDTERQVGEDDLQLMQSIANQVALAMHLTRLAVEGNRSAVLGERTRMARDIHDTLAQGFTGVIIQLEAAKDAIGLRKGEEADAHIERAALLARQSLAEARRSVHALRPLALEHGSLGVALSSMLENMTAGTDIRGHARTEGDAYAIALDREEDLLRIGQEAITNALKHGTPRSIEVLLRFSPTEIVLEVQDDGVGFDPSRQSEGMGLQGMQERCARMEGRFELDTSPGRGARVRVTLSMDL